MPTLPRLIVVDPIGDVSEQVRSALTLLDRLATQIDVPSAQDALEELMLTKAAALITTWDVGDGMRGWELAARVVPTMPTLRVIIMADYDDTHLDDQVLRDASFLYFRRPYDVAQFLRVMLAVLDGKDPHEVLLPPVTSAASVGAVSPKVISIPQIDVGKARPIIYRFMSDLNAMAVLLLSRDGKVLVEHGTLGYINREALGNALTGSSMSLLALHEMAMGIPAMFQFYDGDNYDLYVLSAGFHHMLVVIFDGERGSRELGAVRSFGRRAVEDLIALIGAEAMILSLSVEPPAVDAAAQRSRARHTKTEEVVQVVRADLLDEPAQQAKAAEKPILEAIQGDLDLDRLFNASSDADPDKLFSLDTVAQAVARLDDRSSSGTLDWDKAQELGLLGGE